MNKKQWQVHWRETRIKSRFGHKLSIKTNIFVEVLKELYGYIYLPKQEVFLHLVNRYKEKLSSEYIINAEKLKKSWKPEAKIRAENTMKNLIYTQNPLLKIIPKDSNFIDTYPPIPIK